MTSTCGAVGGFTRFAVEATGTAPRTFADTSETYSVLYESLGSERILQGNRGITGTRSRWVGPVRPHSYLVKGTVAMQCSPNALTKWLPRIFGGTYTAGAPGSVTLGDVLPSFDVMVDRENGVFQYTDCVVAQAVIRGQSAQGGEGEELIELVMLLIGKTEDTAATYPSPAPALTADAADAPFGIWEGDLVVDSATLPFDQFSLVVNNHLSVRFRNSLTANCIRATDRSVSLSVELPFTSAAHAKVLAANTADVAGSLTFTNSALVTAFSFPNLRSTYATPTVPGKSDIPLKAAFDAYRDASAAEVAISHTP